MIRSYKGIWPTIPESCYVDESAQVLGDVVLGENASIWMNAVVRGDVNYIRIGANSNIQDCSVHARHAEPVAGRGRRLGHRRPQRHAARLRGRRPLPDRDGRHHSERRAHRRGSIIAAGTLIPEETVIPPGSLVMGVPGKVRKQLSDEEQQPSCATRRIILGTKRQYLAEKGRSEPFGNWSPLCSDIDGR